MGLLKWLRRKETPPAPAPPVLVDLSPPKLPPPRDPIRVVINQEIMGGQVVSGKVCLAENETVYTKDEAPIDALGSFVLINHERLGIIVSDWSRPGGPQSRDLKPGEVELAITIDCCKYSVELRAFTERSGPEARLPSSFRWPGWASRERAVGMMVWQHADIVGLALEYDRAHPIQVKHPNYPDQSGHGTDEEYDN